MPFLVVMSPRQHREKKKRKRREEKKEEKRKKEREKKEEKKECECYTAKFTPRASEASERQFFCSQ